MADQADWGALANTRIGDVEPPKPMPTGHYAALISGLGKQVRGGPPNDTLGIEFPLRISEPLGDVDAEEFAASDGIKQDAAYKLTFWLSPAALYRFTDFGKSMGASDDLNVLELAEFLGSCNEPIVVEASHQKNTRNPDAPPFLRFDNPVPMSRFSGQ